MLKDSVFVLLSQARMADAPHVESSGSTELLVGIICTPPTRGSWSVNATEEIGNVESLLVILKVSVVEPVGSRSGFGLKDLTIEGVAGGGCTAIVASALSPGKVSVASIGSVIFRLSPMLIDITLTVREQVPPPDKVPPVKFSTVFPAAGVHVPPQALFAAPDGVATVIPAGSSS